ncbi:hypothetical protein BT67DRAFT_252868 [Trichocladium antarcticum]|uniref:Uncharacterized protein n=1 Tax=Trichocladium antarcticum TaxID=1450529 RepID=A0AAN6Z8N5_9PEZI|nr:hypothetical protein BT67DRAFT_252868 [Trichocladium antarcticum]
MRTSGCSLLICGTEFGGTGTAPSRRNLIRVCRAIGSRRRLLWKKHLLPGTGILVETRSISISQVRFILLVFTISALNLSIAGWSCIPDSIWQTRDWLSGPNRNPCWQSHIFQFRWNNEVIGNELISNNTTSKGNRALFCCENPWVCTCQKGLFDCQEAGALASGSRRSQSSSPARIQRR